MTKGETELELIPFVEGGELLVLWQLHREGLGQAVELTTGQLLCTQQHQQRLLVRCQIIKANCKRPGHDECYCYESMCSRCFVRHTPSAWSTVQVLSRHA